MAVKVRYRYTVYNGCDEATEKSKKWERKKKLSWSLWLCLGIGTLSGANAISQLITNRYDAEMFWPMIIVFVIFLLSAYSYVFDSKYVYPTCEELFLRSKRTEINCKELDKKIRSIANEKWKNVKRALLKFSVIYFTIFSVLIIFYCIN